MKRPSPFRLPILVLLLSILPAAQMAAHGDEVPYVPTPEVVVEAMLSLAEVTAADNLVDLGSGDGRIVITAARNFKASALGIEYNPDLIARSREAAAYEGVEDRATFLQRDIFLADIGNATVVTLYLLPEVNRKLRPRILSELRPGTRVVSHDFDMGDWDPDAQRWIEVPEKTLSYDKRSLVYLWIVPARISGRWIGTIAGPGGEDPVVLEFDQLYQKASIKTESARWKHKGSCRLNGEQFVLLLEGQARASGAAPVRFELRVRGDVIEGDGKDGKQLYTLKAKRSSN